MQQAFLDRDAYQCGYCTPGQICSAIAVLAEAAQGWPSAVTPPEIADRPGRYADAGEVRERMAGNLCRCGAYANIVPAVLDARECSDHRRRRRAPMRAFGYLRAARRARPWPRWPRTPTRSSSGAAPIWSI